MIRNFEAILDDLEVGRERAAFRDEQGHWHANRTVKQAILEAFRAGVLVSHGDHVDKDTVLPRQFRPEDGVRIVPGGSAIRRGACVSPGVVRDRRSDPTPR